MSIIGENVPQPSCTFCRKRVQTPTSNPSECVDPENAATLIRTLCQAANIPIVLPSQNYFHCSTCDKILSEIATHYTQLQAQLRSIKSIILEHFNPQNTQESHFESKWLSLRSNFDLRQALVKDLSPSLILKRVNLPEPTTSDRDNLFLSEEYEEDEEDANSIQIKQEEIIVQEPDHDHEDFGAILPPDNSHELLDIDIDIDQRHVDDDPDFKPPPSSPSASSSSRSSSPFQIRPWNRRHRRIRRKPREKNAKVPKVVRKVLKPETVANRIECVRTDDNRVLCCGVEILTLPNGRFGCGQCQIKSKFRASILKHIKITHPERRPHTCPQPGCGYSAVYKHILDKHAAVHRVDKPFICEKCGVSFKRKSNVWEHDQRVHLKVVNAICPHPNCGKGFYTRKDLRLHSKGHPTEM